MMGMKDKRESWKRDIASWQSSGMTLSAWCKENNISYNTFLYRRKRLEDMGKNREPTKFLELCEEARNDSGVSLSINGISLQLSGQFDEEVLLRCLRVIRSL